MPTLPDPVPPSPVVHRWDALAADAPMDLLERRRVIGAQCMISRVLLRRGCVVPSHAHANEQFVVMVSGRMRFTLADREVVVTGGDVLHLPSWAPHGCEALDDTLVLDVFAPPSATTGIDRH